MSMEFEFLSAWKRLGDSSPAPFEVVVTKTKSGNLTYDWLEPFDGKWFFGEPHGSPTWWMPLHSFNTLAPQGVAEHLEPVSEESNTLRLSRQQAYTGNTEAVPDGVCLREVLGTPLTFDDWWKSRAEGSVSETARRVALEAWTAATAFNSRKH